MEGTSCGTFCYHNLLHPAALLASLNHFSRHLSSPASSPILLSNTYWWFTIHLSPKLLSLSSVKPGKELHICPTSFLGEQEHTTELPSLFLSTSESCAAAHQALHAQAGVGQWYQRLRNSILEIVLKAVWMFQLLGPWYECYLISPLPQRKPFPD